MALGQTASKKGLDQGDVIAGKFIVERTIGMGGMGQVVCARHHELGTRVAIKVVHPYATDAENIGRFKREARAMATLTSEHAVRVYDVGENEFGQPYMIMEYLDGRDLGSLLLDRGPLPIDDVVEWMLQACEALIEAHDAKIIHRDLKPQNLFVTKNDTQLRVLDFGLAKPFSGFGATEQKLTRPGDIIGTSQYMAPEQVRGHALDGRTDIWGVGVCMYRLMTKEFPFPGTSPTIICTSILAEPPVPVRQRLPDIRADVEAIVNRCLQKDPAHRFQSMRELAAALRSARRSPRSSSANLHNDDDDGGGGGADGLGSTTATMMTPALAGGGGSVAQQANKPITLPLGAPLYKAPQPTGPEWTSTHAMMLVPAPKPAVPAPIPAQAPTPLPVQASVVPVAPPSPQHISQPQVPASNPRGPSSAPAMAAVPVRKGSPGKVVGAIILVAIWIGVVVVGVVLVAKRRAIAESSGVSAEPAASTATLVLAPPPPPPPPPLVEEPSSASVAASAAPSAAPPLVPTTTPKTVRAQASAAPRAKPTSSASAGGLYDHL